MVPQFCSRTATHTNWGWNRDYTVKLGPKRQGDFKDNSIIFFGWVRISFVFFCFFVFVFFLGSDLRELSVGNRFWTDCIFQFVFPARICFGFRRILLRKKKQGKQIFLLVVTEAYLPPTQFHVVVERERKGAREREREFEDEMMMMMRKKKNPFRELSRILLQRNNCSSPVLMSSGLSLLLLL